MSLTEKQKEQFIKQLEQDERKDFDAEYTRVCALQMKLVEEYGFEGVKLVQHELNSENYYNLGSFPEDSPWFALNKLTIPEAIDTVFKPLSEAHLSPETLVEELKERCQFLYTEKSEGRWLLHYWLKIIAYDQTTYFKVMTGGEPIENPKPNAGLKKFGWTVPEDLVAFYEVHNGFGEEGNSIVYPNEEIKVMAEYMKKLKGTDEYTFENLLEIANDGAGNTICFLRESKEDENGDDVFDWDHETLELTDQYGFWGYLDEVKFDEIDEEDWEDESEDSESDEDDLEDIDLDDLLEDEKYEEINFGKKYKITSSYKISAATIEKYRKLAPPSLVKLWETHGLPVINEGMMTFINPDDYFPTLDLWLGKHVENYIPMAIGAFGNLFYYRKLQQGEEDVCQIEPHHREIDTCAWSFKGFFEEYLYDDYTKDYVLREKEFKAALKKNGPLAQHEMYMFVPALVLGGEESGKSTDKGEARVHLDFLFQATQ